jgi:hypothetical protein
MYTNALLIFVAFAYITNGILVFEAIKKPIQGGNLEKLINSYFKRIKNISIISLSITVSYTSCQYSF